MKDELDELLAKLETDLNQEGLWPLPDGYELSDPAIRKRLLETDCFVSFPLVNLPTAIQTYIDGSDGELSAIETEAIEKSIDRLFKLAPKYYASLDWSDKKIWIYRDPDFWGEVSL